MMIRLLDFCLAAIGLAFFSPLIVFAFIISSLDTGNPIFVQRRIGHGGKAFTLYKFRSMSRDTLSVPTHKLQNVQISKVGRFLRLTKLDELPQLVNVLIGNMSFVGPRPCLETQTYLIQLRETKGVFEKKPGITGLAQINNVTMETPDLLVQYDIETVKNLTVSKYFKILTKTLRYVLFRLSR